MLSYGVYGEEFMTKTDPIFKGEGLELSPESFRWSEDDLLAIDKKRFEEIKLPEEDFVQPKFDVDYGAKPSSLVLLISSPRSGSTALCSYLYRKAKLVTHEYFQPFQYLPFLADRWGCVADNKIDPKCYMEALVRHRMSDNGALGVNLHGSHLNIFDFFEEHALEKLPKVAIYLKRRDKIAQAVSYYIASNTKAWSSHFSAIDDFPPYSFSGIKAKLTNILNQEKRAELYLEKHKVPSQTVWYEDLSSGAVQLVSFLEKAIGVDSLTFGEASTRKQASLQNVIYAERFTRELLIEQK